MQRDFCARPEHLVTPMVLLLRAVLFGILLFSTLAMSTGSEGTVTRRRVMTWVPPYAVGDSKLRLDESFGEIGMKDGITHLGLQFWNPTVEGGVEFTARFGQVDDTAVSEFREWGHAHGIRVMLCVYNGSSSGWDWDLARSAFDSHRPEFVEALIQETLRLKLDGVDIDLEGIGDLESSKSAFVQFIKELSERLHAEGKELSVDTFAYKWHAPRKSWWPELLPHIDGLNVMGYLETGSTSSGWKSYDSLIAAAGMYRSKVLIGMPSHAADWEGEAHLEHLSWVTEHEPAGLAIWDARLLDPKWRSKETWLEIKKIRGGSEELGEKTIFSPRSERK